MSKIQTNIFIKCVEKVEVNENFNIPTAVFYKENGGYEIGYDALNKKFITGKEYIVNENFKVVLGTLPTTETAKYANIPTEIGTKVSASRLAGDFFSKTLSGIEKYLKSRDIKTPKKILISEPLAIQEGLVEKDWLKNYRMQISALLESKSFEVSFLPEPFAVFQYYRYGARLAAISGNQVFRVLVIDFGGGTFDICVIETSKSGDIKAAGKNSIPIGAASEAVGGFYINQVAVEDFLLNVSSNKFDKSKITLGIKSYKEFKKNPVIFDGLSEGNQNFIRNFQKAVSLFENAKIELVGLIRDWDLNNPIAGKVAIKLPMDWFALYPQFTSVSYTAEMFRDTFIKRIWKERLKNIVKQCLQRSEDALKGAPLSAVLLSGGSSNIGWLSKLLLEDFFDNLEGASLITLPDYQEVVSNGLAIECARRMYADDGDFANVTYNTLCLILNPDETEYFSPEFKPLTDGIPPSEKRGVLLPTASILKSLYDIPLRWRTKFQGHPRHSIDYQFLRNSLDPNDLSNLLNLDTHVDFETKISPDNHVKIELRVREDGTTIPRFIYKTDSQQRELYVDGKPFVIDLTTGGHLDTEPCYLGIDFGSSNSSVSFVQRSGIETYTQRESDSYYSNLYDIVRMLPYPLSTTLAKYLMASNVNEQISEGKRFVEACLSLFVYMLYQDYCFSTKNINTKYFKGFTQRSAGPLVGFLRDMINLNKSNHLLHDFVLRISNKETIGVINQTADFIANAKHEKVDSAFNLQRSIEIFANLAFNIHDIWLFGFFDNFVKKSFSQRFRGNFIIARGNGLFYEKLDIESVNSFGSNECFLLNRQNGIVLPLSPFIIWAKCDRHLELSSGHSLFFDIFSEGTVEFVAPGYNCPRIISSVHEVPLSNQEENQDLLRLISQSKITDQPAESYSIDILESNME